jgi:hypothetical protein
VPSGNHRPRINRNRRDERERSHHVLATLPFHCPRTPVRTRPQRADESLSSMVDVHLEALRRRRAVRESRKTREPHDLLLELGT